jgi:predicted nucleotidyltransferase
MIAIDTYLREAVAQIVDSVHPEMIILFGSHAYGKPDDGSDLDLLVVMDTDELPHRRAIPLRKLLRNLGVPKEIIVRTPEEFRRFRDVVGTVIYPAARYGRVLYER